MIDVISTIIFIVGILSLIITYVITFRSKSVCSKEQIISQLSGLIMSISIIGFAWILREVRLKEKYYKNAYDGAYQTGKLIGGTVYASYPENSPGLGWII